VIAAVVAAMFGFAAGFVLAKVAHAWWPDD
jgi:hypothetical protein